MLRGVLTDTISLFLKVKEYASMNSVNYVCKLTWFPQEKYSRKKKNNKPLVN